MIKKPALLFGMLLLSACASQEKISSIDTGMSRQQIITALGNPDSEYSKDDLEILTYRNKKPKEGANKQVISSQADSLIKISRIWADFFPANTSNQPI